MSYGHSISPVMRKLSFLENFNDESWRKWFEEWAPVLSKFLDSSDGSHCLQATDVILAGMAAGDESMVAFLWDKPIDVGSFKTGLNNKNIFIFAEAAEKTVEFSDRMGLPVAGTWVDPFFRSAIQRNNFSVEGTLIDLGRKMVMDAFDSNDYRRAMDYIASFGRLMQGDNEPKNLLDGVVGKTVVTIGGCPYADPTPSLDKRFITQGDATLARDYTHLLRLALQIEQAGAGQFAYASELFALGVPMGVRLRSRVSPPLAGSLHADYFYRCFLKQPETTERKIVSIETLSTQLGQFGLKPPPLLLKTQLVLAGALQGSPVKFRKSKKSPKSAAKVAASAIVSYNDAQLDLIDSLPLSS